MTREESIEVIKAYKDKLTNSASNQLDGDIEAFDMAIKALEQEPSGDLISREAVLDAIEELKKIHFDRVVVLNKVRDRVLELPSVNPQEPKGKCLLSQKYRDWQFIQEPKTGHWISVSERLPDKNVWVLVTVEQGSGWYVETMRIDKYKGMFTDDIDYYDSVIAWMPLPKPYEPQESDHKCHTCKHYTSGEQDGSCDSYICEHYSGWESEEE